MKELSPEGRTAWAHAVGGSLRPSDVGSTEVRLPEGSGDRVMVEEAAPPRQPVLPPQPLLPPLPPMPSFPDSSPDPGRSRRRKQTSGWTNVVHGGVIVAVLGLLAAAGVSLAVFTAPEKKQATAPSKVPPRTVNTAIYDRFDRGDASTSIGAAETGQPWAIVGAPWGVQDGQATLASADAGKRTVAVIGLGTGDGVVQVTMPKVIAGGGLVFRYHDAFNYWAFTAAPKFGTWNIQKVVDGQTINLGNVGRAPVVDNTTISAKFQGDHVAFLINGAEVKSLDDPAFNTERFAGMVGIADDEHAARFDNFVGTVARTDASTEAASSSK